MYALVKTRMPGLNRCATGANATGLPADKHKIEFTVTAAGVTDGVKLGRKLRASAAGRCIKGQVRKWHFPAATGAATVSFPLILTR